jgi:hypothetical protein
MTSSPFNVHVLGLDDDPDSPRRCRRAPSTSTCSGWTTTRTAHDDDVHRENDDADAARRDRGPWTTITPSVDHVIGEPSRREGGCSSTLTWRRSTP